MRSASVENILVIKATLRSFEMVSILKVNFSKTKVGGLALNMAFI